MEQLYRFPAYDVAERLRCKDITSSDVVRAALARITEREGGIGAWAHLDPGLALNNAQAADVARRAGQDLGPLHGIPVGIKDIIDVAGLPCEHGTPVFAGRRPSADAAVVRNLRAAGAVILGKTVTTELAFFGPGKTRNPHNPEHTPGGSSSGSAAAVADFHVPLALGTQTAGSIIRPASYCGVIGFKPTFGLVPRDGVLEQSPPLDTIGGYARTVGDIAQLMTAMTGGTHDFTPRRERSGPLRFAFIKSLAWPDGDPAMKSALEKFAAETGAQEVQLPAAFNETAGLQLAVQFRDIAKNYGLYLDTHPGVISAKLAEVVGIGRGVSDSEYQAALAHRGPLYDALAGIVAEFDAILTPAAQGVAPCGLASTGSPMFNFLWTYLGMPAISLPLLQAEGLPLGVQLVGARGEDANLLGVAGAVIGKASITSRLELEH